MAPSTRRHPRGRGPIEAGTLFVVATPIGNLEDITLRALRVLREAAVVAAEDTRRTGNLLRHYGIATPLLSLHAHNEQQRLSQVLSRLERGDSVALVSDAGTPGISDPGALVVRAARKAGFRVEPVPGPSAVTAALSASGLSFERFAFAGFPPIRSKHRKLWLEWVATLSDTPVVFFEAPHRLERTLADVMILGNRPIILARELTKMFEEWTFAQLPRDLSETASPPQGEYVVILGETTKTVARAAAPTDRDIADVFGRVTASTMGGSRRDALRAVAEQLGVSTKTVFDALERAKRQPA